MESGDGLDDRPADPEKNPLAHARGHRRRLKARFDKGGRGAVADYELIELLLFLAVPQRDVKPLAKDLLARFGSVAGVLAAPPARLAEAKGAGANVAHVLGLVRAAAEALTRDALADQPIISSWSALLDYVRATMAFETVEQFRILFLDRKNRLIADEVQQRGTVDHTPVYPREVVKRGLELSATAMILVHNHPSGDPTPSKTDIEMTRRIAAVAEPLGIAVHDHLIVGKQGHASLRALGLIK